MVAQESAINDRIGRAKRFLRGALFELKKVSWPDKRELSAYTAVVFVSVFFAATMIGAVDSFFSWALRTFLNIQ